MIVYDGIINSLQSHGGISVLFHELNKRMAKNSARYYVYNEMNNVGSNAFLLSPRILERYRKFNIKLNENDIFHSTYYRLPQSNTTVVTTVHDFTYEKYIGGIAAKVHSHQKNNAILNSDKIICVSNNTAEDLLRYCRVPESKIAVVYNGVSDDYYPLNLECQDYVVFVGSRVSYKNFSMVVSAVSRFKDLKLVIVGGGKLTAYEACMLEEKLKGRFEVTGILSNKELNVVYNQAIALAYPSEYEGFGIPVIEAQKSGCPVIALNRSSIPEIAGSAAVLLEQADENNIYDAIQMLLYSDFRKQLLNLGFENAKRFSWDKCFKETQLIYSK
ncbi:glycosyltransferase family 4 protein [Aeromonas hydrophila]|uniref:glycosyltransferase family 4 protein n=1 Tax=Aeromonas hydrophila TaxID=644 RepID=UPI00207BB57D|nr:glycosyltransferase family 1 protein [Aeromonas hydrophila]